MHVSCNLSYQFFLIEISGCAAVLYSSWHRTSHSASAIDKYKNSCNYITNTTGISFTALDKYPATLSFKDISCSVPIRVTFYGRRVLTDNAGFFRVRW